MKARPKPLPTFRGREISVRNFIKVVRVDQLGRSVMCQTANLVRLSPLRAMDWSGYHGNFRPFP